MHILLPVLLATLTLFSQQSLANGELRSDTCPLECVALIATQDGRVRVIITKTKAKLHLPKTQRPVIRLSLDDDDNDYYDELPDLQVGYRRPELVNQTAEVHNDLSDEIKLRLALARMKALEAYNKKWA